MNVQTYLVDNQVSFGVEAHPRTYDAQHLAQAVHAPGACVAKTVLLRADHGFSYVLAVLPADRRVDLAQASRVLGGSELQLATELEVTERCHDCEEGVIPPFGSQYGIQTIIDRSLLEQDEIVFEGNRHDEAIRMKASDFQHLEEPLVGEISYRAK